MHYRQKSGENYIRGNMGEQTITQLLTWEISYQLYAATLEGHHSHEHIAVWHLLERERKDTKWSFLIQLIISPMKKVFMKRYFLPVSFCPLLSSLLFY